MTTYSTPFYDDLLKQYDVIKAQPQVADAALAGLAKLIEKAIEAGFDTIKRNHSNRALLENGIEDCRRMSKLLATVAEDRVGLAKGRQD